MFLLLPLLSSPISYVFIFERTITSEISGSHSFPKVKPVLNYFPEVSPFLMMGGRGLLILCTRRIAGAQGKGVEEPTHFATEISDIVLLVLQTHPTLSS